jgi:hypothetical protein
MHLMFDVLTSVMRTTLEIADDVLQAARERARREGKTMGAVLSDLARLALTSHREARSHGERKPDRGFQPFPSRGGIVTNDLIDHLREDDAY